MREGSFKSIIDLRETFGRVSPVKVRPRGFNRDQGHLVVHIYFISVDTFYEIGLDFHAISRKNVNIRKLKSKAEPKTK